LDFRLSVHPQSKITHPKFLGLFSAGGADDPTTCLVPPMAGRFANNRFPNREANLAGPLGDS
jgi:hypothetical protein